MTHRPVRPSRSRRTSPARLLAVSLVAVLAVVGLTTPAAAAGFQVHGKVVLPQGVDPAVLREFFVEPVDSPTGAWPVAPDGSFTVRLDQPSRLWVQTSPRSGLVGEYYGGAYREAGAVVVGPEQAGTSLDVHLETGATISGRFTYASGDSTRYVVISALPAEYGDGASGHREVVTAYASRDDGSYTVRGLAPGRYVLEIGGTGSRYWPSARQWSGATPVDVAAGAAVTGIDGEAPYATTTTARKGELAEPSVQVTLALPHTPGVAPVGDVEVRDRRGAVVGRATFRTADGGSRTIRLPSIATSPGSHPLTVDFLGTGVYDPSRTTFTLVVDPDVMSISPVRVLDTRAPGPVCVDVRTAAALPPTATAVMLNVTAAGPTGPGYGIVYADTAGDGSTPPPPGSTVNFEPGADVANWALVAVPPHGRICYGTGGGAAVRKILDVGGYVSSGSGLRPVPSVRLVDTRSRHVGTLRGPVTPRTVTTVQVAGLAGVPTDATSVLLNVTVTCPTTPGNLRVIPARSAVPNTSVVNFAPGYDKANATLVPLVDGKVAFWSDSPVPAAQSPVQVILDVVAYTQGRTQLTPVAPTRILDSRPRSRIGNQLGRLVPSTTHLVPVAGVGPVPANAVGVLLSVTAVSTPAAGNLRVYPQPTSSTVPGTSTLNYVDGRDVANLVMVPIGRDGAVGLFSDSGYGSPFVTADVVAYIGGS